MPAGEGEWGRERERGTQIKENEREKNEKVGKVRIKRENIDIMEVRERGEMMQLKEGTQRETEVEREGNTDEEIKRGRHDDDHDGKRRERGNKEIRERESVCVRE